MAEGLLFSVDDGRAFLENDQDAKSRGVFFASPLTNRSHLYRTVLNVR